MVAQGRQRAHGVVDDARLVAGGHDRATRTEDRRRARSARPRRCARRPARGAGPGCRARRARQRRRSRAAMPSWSARAASGMVIVSQATTADASRKAAAKSPSRHRRPAGGGACDGAAARAARRRSGVPGDGAFVDGALAGDRVDWSCRWRPARAFRRHEATPAHSVSSPRTAITIGMPAPGRRC